MKKSPLKRPKSGLKRKPFKNARKAIAKKPFKSKPKSNFAGKNLPKKPLKTKTKFVKRKGIRKEGQSELAKEIKQCDLWFSRWVRLSSSDEHGNVKCFTCDFVGYYKQNSIQNGHYVSRNAMMCRWLKLNNHPQCEKCNMLLSGNLKVYAENLEKTYGKGIVEYLQKEGKKTNKLTLEKVRKLRNHFETEFVLLKSKLK